MLAARPATAAYIALRRRRQNELTLVPTGSHSRRCISGSALSWPTANTSLSSSSAPTPPVSAGLPRCHLLLSRLLPAGTSRRRRVSRWQTGGTLKPLFVGADAVTPTVIQFAALATLLGSRRLSDSAETAAFRRDIAATVAVPMLESRCRWPRSAPTS
jgi:hypothetical protein